MDSFKYNGEMFTTVNPNDPLATKNTGKQDHVANNGVAGYNSQGTRSYSRMVPRGVTNEVVEAYQSDHLKMMEDYSAFMDPMYFKREDVTDNATSSRIVRLGGYKFVDLDPVAEGWHGKTRTIGEVCTTLGTQRYASWLVWSEESNLSDIEITKRNVLIQELMFDMKVRVPAMLSYHATVLESSHIYGNCSNAAYGDVAVTDTVSLGMIEQVKNLFKFNVGYTATTVLLDSVAFANVLDQVADLPMYKNGSVPQSIMSAFNDDANTFTIRGITFKESRLIEAIPINTNSPITGDINTQTDMSFAIIMGGQFGRQTSLNKNGVTNKVVTKEAGSVVPFDLLNQYSSFAYRIYFGVKVLDPGLVVTYYFANSDESCGVLDSAEAFYALSNQRVSAQFNRRVASPVDGIVNDISFLTPTAVAIRAPLV